MNNKYDVAIIGAGIGGLTCGCYLAKHGLKVLIAEQHDKPGGCCTSFDRKGFRFDVGVHYLGSLREGGILSEILKDLKLLDKIKFITNDPTDRIIIPDMTVFIRKDRKKTKKELIAHFPKEKENIGNFFNFILNNNFLGIFSKTKKLTFKNLLDNFFSDNKLKAILSTLLGNLGLPPSQASALVSTVIYEEFILDGGYYPKGGIQVLPDLLSFGFKKYGGKLLLSTEVIKIMTKNKKIIGIKLQNNEFVSARVIISNADATLTFSNLLDCECEEMKKIEELEVSPSAFVIYLGLDKVLDIKPKHFTTWFFMTDNVEKCYNFNRNKKALIPNLDYMLCSFPSLIDPSLAPPGKSIMRIFIGARYADKKIWEQNKNDLYEIIVDNANKKFPNLKSSIQATEIGTPNSFYRYTRNKEGALFGWKAIPTQVDRNTFPCRTSIENLYLAGHWTTNGAGQSGVAVVAYSGKYTAKSVIKKLKK